MTYGFANGHPTTFKHYMAATSDFVNDANQPPAKPPAVPTQALVVEKDDTLLTYLVQRRNTANLCMEVLREALPSLTKAERKKLAFYADDFTDCSKAIAMLTGFN